MGKQNWYFWYKNLSFITLSKTHYLSYQYTNNKHLQRTFRRLFGTLRRLVVDIFSQNIILREINHNKFSVWLAYKTNLQALEKNICFS
ncbi:MAG: hypothetical protein WAQ98_20055 [Blastocatellia bacterium]